MTAPRMMHYAAATLAITAVTWGVAGAGCSIDAEPAAPPPEEEIVHVADAFAFTPDCAACSATALQGVCGAEAQACLADPACANVPDCIAACPPGDPMCIATCYQNASQILDIVAECVVCDECPVECAGAWSCSGGAGGGGAGGMGGAGGAGGASGGAGGASSGTCDNQGDCNACVACAIAAPPCDAIVQACLTDPTCLLDPTPAFECVVCQECANDCAGTAPPFPGLSCP
jgi:hypothetical protein